MPIIPLLSILDQGTLASAEAANHFAAVLHGSWNRFWYRPVETVLAELNADVAKTLEVFILNTQAATAVNAILSSVGDPRFSHRAPDYMPEGYAFDGTQFTFTAPVQPEPQPDPQPEP